MPPSIYIEHMFKSKFINQKEKPKQSLYIPEYVQRGVKPIKMERKFLKDEKIEDYHHTVKDDVFTQDMSPFYIKDSLVPMPEEYTQSQEVSEQPDDLLSVVKNSSSDDFIVLIDSEVFCVSPKEEVEGICNDLIFGRGQHSQSEPIDYERITIIKKVSIKVGLFLQ